MQGPVFIIGCVRSGTTLLRDILRTHSNLEIPEETHFYRWASPFGTHPFVRDVGNSPLMKKHREMDGADEKAFQHHMKTASSRKELTENYMQLFLRGRGAENSCWGDKTPQHVYGLPLLLHDFPDARFVHIVRNPLNVIASLMVGKVIAAPSVTAAANYWYEALAIINTCKPLMENKLLEIRYEDLTSAPKQEIAALCAFLGLNPKSIKFDTKLIHKERNQYKSVIKPEWMGVIRKQCGKYADLYGYDISI